MNIEQNIKIYESCPKIMDLIEARTEKAKELARKLIEEIDSNGMSIELDRKCETFLNNCKKVKDQIYTQRKPITQIFDSIRKRFTEAEGVLDNKKCNSVSWQIQYIRDKWASEYSKLIRINELTDISQAIDAIADEPKVKTIKELTIKNRAGLGEILKFWYKTLPADYEINESTTIGQIKNICIKGGIIPSENIEYKEIIKSVNRK